MVRLKVASEDLVRLGVNESLASSYDDTELRERIEDLEEDKVDKVAGKGLSTNDYTDADKVEVAKIDGIEEDIESLDLTKANIDGYYDTLSVGLADNLIDRKGNGTPQEISYRTSCGDDSIADDGNGIIQSIFGKTVVWNQYMDKSRYFSTYTSGTVTMTNNGDGSITIDVSAPPSSRVRKVFQNSSIDIPYGHKVFMMGGISSAIQLYDSYAGASSYENGNGVIYTSSYSEGLAQPEVFVNTSCTAGTYKVTPRLFDLTQLFGAGNEPTTVDDPRIEWIKQYATAHPEYNSGELVSYNGSGIKTVGFNQWDEVWESGWINPESGNPIANNSRIRSKNFCDCLGGITYYCLNNSSKNWVIIQYDADKEQVDYWGVPANSYKLFTADSRARYFKVAVNQDGITTYKNDININFSWSGYRNGEYEPYWTRTLNLPISTYFPDGMKSVGNNRDEITKDKATQRIGERAYQSGDENDTSVVTDMTTTYYALETPIETTITPPLDLTYKVADFGTEESIAEGKSTPFNGIIKYSDDFTRGLVNMPKNYDTTASLDALATSLSTMLTSALDGTVTITRGAYDSTNKKYAWNCSYTPNA